MNRKAIDFMLTSSRIFLLFLGILPLISIGCGAFAEDDVYCFAVDYDGTEYCVAEDENTPVAIITPTAVPASATSIPTYNSVESFSGYTLISPLFSENTYLLDNSGEPIHTWDITRTSGGVAYLLDDGKLLQTGIIEESTLFPEAVRTGGGGYLQMYSWDGELLWEYEHVTETQLQHHDIEPMPNGNVLFIVYERFLAEEAIAVGRSAELFPDGREEIWSEAILEIDPSTNEIVWEWHVWDHLVQDVDPNLPNYGNPAELPDRIDINYFVNFDENVGTHVEWLHANAIDYSSELDQILFSPRQSNELWIIDHDSTIEEAAGEKGDLLFRWGNAAAHGIEENAQQNLYFAHDPRWTSDGTILIFNNGAYSVREYSSVLEILPEMGEGGRYQMDPNMPTEVNIVWEYKANTPTSFFSFIMGSAQRLPNGNTLIADSFNKRVFEVNEQGDLVWEWFEPGNYYVFRADRYETAVLPTFIQE